ncbi:hypothetical protein [Gracilibacillus massiliensis]|uniref:hypothetical protein n=1 Tax=Gracilibacillus massiliensis TaxID=1564956 RepID=UPI00071DA56D|nr:hypothetical protein [Gracilibacillus massiliensis]
MRKIIGIIIIVISVLFGVASATLFFEDGIAALIGILVFCLPLFIAGQIIRSSWTEFKNKKMYWIWIYLFFFLFVPVCFNFLISIDELKKQVFNAEEYIIFRPKSSSLIGGLQLFSFFVFCTLFFYRFFVPHSKGKKIITKLIISLAVFLICFSYLMFKDYRGVHPEDGLVRSNWLGNQTTVSFDQIDSINLDPDYSPGGHARYGGSPHFIWSIEFKHDNEHSTYNFTLIDKSNLENTILMKELASKRQIPFTVEEMNKEAYDLLALDLEFKELDEDKYYQLFEVSKK